MAYTSILKLAQPVTGTEDGTWGETVNNAITEPIEEAIAGTVTVAHTDAASITLTSGDGSAANQSRYMFINVTGALTAARQVICPAASKLYFVANNTTGGFAITFKTSSGSGISVANGQKAALYCDGTNVVYAFDQVTLQPTVTISGNMDNGTTDYAVTATPAVQSNVTTSAVIFNTAPTTEADTFTLTGLRHFYAQQGTFGAGSTVTSQYGFVASSSLTGAQYNYGFHSNLASKSAVTISSINGTGSTVTVETATSHGLADNDYVFINLVPQTTMISGSYNGYYQVTVVDTDTFTYSSSATSSAAVTSGYVTPSGRWNLYMNGTGQNRFDGSVIVDVSSYVDALRITQSGGGNALIVEDATNPDTTPFVIDTNGNVISGYTSVLPALSAAGGSFTPTIQTTGTTQSATSMAFQNYSTSTAGPVLSFVKSKSGTIGTLATNTDGDDLASFAFVGVDAAVTPALKTAAYIIAEVDGSPSSTTVPGSLNFGTTGGTSTSPTVRMRIDSSGNTILGSGEATSTPVGNVLRAPNGAGTNIAGGTLGIYSGVGTGTGQGGNLGFFTSAAPGSSGTTQNTPSERMRIYSSSSAADGPKGIHVAFSGVFPSTVPLSGLNGTYTPFTVNGVNEETAAIGIINWGVSSSDEGVLCFSAMNSGTVGSYGTALTTGTNIGMIEFDGYSGTGTSSGMNCGVSIFAEAYGGTWTATSAPSRLLIACGSTTETSTNRLELAANSFSMLTGTGLTIAETAITTGSSAVGNVFSGTYTPTQVSTNTNIATGPTFSAAQYMRVGNTVTVSGQIVFTATASATDTTVKISLPIASNFSATRQLAGTGAALNTGIFGTNTMVLLADTTNDCVEMRCRPTTTNTTTYQFTFTYQVL